MNRFFFLFFSFFFTLTNAAQAQDTTSTADQAWQECSARYSAEYEIKMCTIGLLATVNAERGDRHQEQLRAHAGAIGILDDGLRHQAVRNDHQDLQLEGYGERIARLEASVGGTDVQLTPEPARSDVQPAAPPPVVPPAVPVSSQQPVSQMQGVVLDEASPSIFMSAYPFNSAQFPNTLRISALNQSSSKSKCGGRNDNPRYVLVTNHGVPQQVATSWNRESNSGFVEAYLDTDQNGTRDVVIKVMDTTRQSTIYTTWEEGDDIRLHYLVLVRTIRRVNQQTGAVDYIPVLRYRNATSGETRAGTVACGLDVLTSPGGTRAFPAYDLVKIRGRIR